MKPKQSCLHSFRYAFNGIVYAIKNEAHIRYHLIITCLILAISWYFNINETEWMVICMSIFLVLISEFFNTSIEHSVDLTTQNPHPLAMASKDIAAAGVLLAAIHAVIQGGIIFIPKLTIMGGLLK